jgi:hypothetical protein
MPDIELKIHEFRYRVQICTALDVTEDGKGGIAISRVPAAKMWAKVYALPHLPSFLSPMGFYVKEKADRVTHWITLRYKADIDFTSAAWIYEERLKSPPRWYKVLGFYDNLPWVVLHCHLVERSVTATPPRTLLTAKDGTM